MNHFFLDNKSASETTMKGSDLISECVNFLHCKCDKINLNNSGSYIDSLDCRKKRKATINPINIYDHNCFQYAVTFALNHEEIGNNSERILKTKPFADKYNWEGIKYHQKKMTENNLRKII